MACCNARKSNPYISLSDTLPGDTSVFRQRDRTVSMDRGASSADGSGTSADLFLQLKKVSLSLEAIISRSMSSISFINLIELRISALSDIFSDGCLAWGTGVTREKDVAVSRAMGSFSLTER
jgi:hypothetical protein